MASAICLRRAVTSATALFSKLTTNPIFPRSASSSLSRFFNTDSNQAVTTSRSSDSDLGRVEVQRSPSSSSDNRSVSRSRRGDNFPSFLPFPDVVDPLSPTRTLTQVLNLMDQFMDTPFFGPPGGIGAGAVTRRGWNVKEDENALHLWLDMPGLSKEDVKICVDQNTLVIKGEGGKEQGDDEESMRRYSSRLDLPPSAYKLDEIRAEVKNGVLKLVLPKVKEEETKKNVYEVKVE